MKQKIPFRRHKTVLNGIFCFIWERREARATTPKARLDVLVDMLDFGDVEGVVVALGVVLLVH